MHIPGRQNRTILAAALTALDRCRNGTIDKFEGFNITNGISSDVVHQMFNLTSNSTIRRRANSDVGGAFPCPTKLFVGEPNVGSRNHIEGRLVCALLAVVLVGFVVGMAM